MQVAGCRVEGAECRVEGARCRVEGAGRRVQGAECRVQGAGLVTWPRVSERLMMLFTAICPFREPKGDCAVIDMGVTPPTLWVMGLRFYGLGFGVREFGFRVCGLGIRVEG